MRTGSGSVQQEDWIVGLWRRITGERDGHGWLHRPTEPTALNHVAQKCEPLFTLLPQEPPTATAAILRAERFALDPFAKQGCMRRVSEAEYAIGRVVSAHCVSARTEGQLSAKAVNDGISVAAHMIRW
jgi:hypothetical protein